MKPPIRFRPPDYETIHVDNPERVIRVKDTVLRVPAQQFDYMLTCGICGAEWEGKWNPETGAPIYSGGIIPSRFYAVKMRRWERSVVACRCSAGHARACKTIRPATDRQWAVTLRRKRWVDRFTAQSFIDTYRESLEPARTRAARP